MDLRGAVQRNARRTAVLVAGVVLLLAGAAMLLLPGPGFVVILAGLAVLSWEFEAPRRWRHKLEAELRARYRRARDRRRDR